jgi:hypothetical protein
MPLTPEIKAYWAARSAESAADMAYQIEHKAEIREAARVLNARISAGGDLWYADNLGPAVVPIVAPKVINNALGMQNTQGGTFGTPKPSIFSNPFGNSQNFSAANPQAYIDSFKPKSTINLTSAKSLLSLGVAAMNNPNANIVKPRGTGYMDVMMYEQERRGYGLGNSFINPRTQDRVYTGGGSQSNLNNFASGNPDNVVNDFGLPPAPPAGVDTNILPEAVKAAGDTITTIGDTITNITNLPGEIGKGIDDFKKYALLGLAALVIIKMD